MTILISLSASAVSVAPAHARTSYCAPKGSVCQAVDKTPNSVVFRWQTLNLRGPYQLCVGPREGVRCVTRRLHRVLANVHRGNIRFKSSFFHRKTARYSVTWFHSGEPVGKTLRFHHEHRWK
ncbi:hypothetical protein HJD18_03515 [Thermoleophilia bacterium SCSIO 60948]|nr:hypothetical protein HJD18_03515 [Thermoleophilia bacterium SCSIO 60948]